MQNGQRKCSHHWHEFSGMTILCVQHYDVVLQQETIDQWTVNKWNITIVVMCRQSIILSACLLSNLHVWNISPLLLCMIVYITDCYLIVLWTFSTQDTNISFKQNNHLWGETYTLILWAGRWYWNANMSICMSCFDIWRKLWSWLPWYTTRYIAL